MPASIAASTTRCVAAASIRPPKLLHPSPTSETSRLPIFRVSMTATLRRGERRLASLVGRAADALHGDAPIPLGEGRPLVVERPRPRIHDAEPVLHRRVDRFARFR